MGLRVWKVGVGVCVPLLKYRQQLAFKTDLYISYTVLTSVIQCFLGGRMNTIFNQAADLMTTLMQRVDT